MANISAIKLPNGTTYDLKDNISGYTTNTGTITKVQTTAGAHTAINVSSGAATFNVPTKTSHLTNDSGFITNSTLYEANLQWGGKNFSASYGPIDAAMIDSLGANRLELVNANGIIVEYSRDNGVTWNDYELADNDKRKIISSIGGSAFLGKYTSADFGNVTTDWKLRITLVFPAAGTYTVLNKFAIYMSSQGANGPYVTIDGCKKSDESVFTVFAENVSINGWSGWNIINTSGITTYANTTSQYSKIRFTFGITSVSSWAGDLDHPTYHSAINISKILGFGGVGWSVPTQLAKDGHLYSYDVNQNAIFPAQITATQFNGPLNGNATSATKATNDVDNNPIKTTYAKLSGATFTGAINTANNTYNKIGDDVQIGDINAAGTLGIKGINGRTGIRLVAYSGSTNTDIYNDGAGNLTITGTVLSTFSGNLTGNVTGNVTGSAGSVAWSGVTSKPTTISGYGITDAKIASGVITLGSNTITPLTSSSTLNAAKLSGAIPSAVTATTQTAGDNSTKIATTAFVSSAISSLPTAMQFIGTVGTNGTVTWADLATAAASNKGYTYKVITAHTAETGKPAAKAGDTIVSNGSEWIVIPSGDETATQSATTGISIANHGTGTVIGVQSTTTTASKVTLGTAISVPNVTGSTDVTVPIRADSDVTVPKAASSATTVPIKNANATTVPTAASSATTVPIKNGSATSVPVVSSNNDATLSFAMDTTDTKKLKISWSATPTRTVFGTAASIYGVQSTTTSVTGVSGSTSIYGVQSTTTSVTGVSGSTTVRGVKTGDNSTTTASKVTLGTAKSIPNVTAATDVTVPIKNASSSTFVTGTTHSITDNGHTHTI